MEKTGFDAFDNAMDITRAMVPILQKIRQHDPKLAEGAKAATRSIGLNIEEGRKRVWPRPPPRVQHRPREHRRAARRALPVGRVGLLQAGGREAAPRPHRQGGRHALETLGKVIVARARAAVARARAARQAPSLQSIASTRSRSPSGFDAAAAVR